jgi:integrase
VARQKKFPPSLCRHKGTGQAYVRLNGSNIYLGKYGTEESRAAYARLIAQLAAGQQPVPARAAPPATVADVICAWWEQEAPRLSEAGREVENYRLSLAPLLTLYGPTDVSSFDAAALEVVQLAMASGQWRTPPVKGGWCAGVVNKRVGRIKTVWRWAERRKLVPDGRWSNLRTLPGLRKNDRRVRHTTKRRPATWQEVKDVCRCCPPAVRTVLLLMWRTGARPAEIYTMTAAEIDTSEEFWTYRPAAHKTAWLGHTRAIPLNRKARSILAPWLRAVSSPDAILFRPVRRSDGHQAECYDEETFARAVNRSAQRAGHKGFTAYQIRHAVKQIVTRLAGLDSARALLGQASLASTAGYGEAADLELAKQAARRLG